MSSQNFYEITVGFSSERASYSQYHGSYHVGNKALYRAAYIFCKNWYYKDDTDGYGDLLNVDIFEAIPEKEMIEMMIKKGINNVKNELGLGWIAVTIERID